jgi:hypothetical protein
LVRIYVHGELIKTHERKPSGGRSTDYTDYPDGQAPYALRWPNHYCKRARELGSAAGDFTDKRNIEGRPFGVGFDCCSGFRFHQLSQVLEVMPPQKNRSASSVWRKFLAMTQERPFEVTFESFSFRSERSALGE